MLDLFELPIVAHRADHPRPRTQRIEVALAVRSSDVDGERSLSTDS